jgi:hypothetical protein
MNLQINSGKVSRTFDNFTKVCHALADINFSDKKTYKMLECDHSTIQKCVSSHGLGRHLCHVMRAACNDVEQRLRLVAKGHQSIEKNYIF